MENLEHRIIKEEVITEQLIQKSKFITYLKPVSSEEEAKEYLKEIRRMHPKATHHCSAFRVGDIERSNDDGEPASSAGLPMLQVLRGNHLQNTIAVVVRYYGGILLGVGGLIRAYGSSVTFAIQEASILSPRLISVYQCVFPYNLINEVETFLTPFADVTQRDYKESVYYEVKTQSVLESNDFSDVTRGSGSVQFIEKYYEYVEE